jgi:hypothetical protein
MLSCSCTFFLEYLLPKKVSITNSSQVEHEEHHVHKHAFHVELEKAENYLLRQRDHSFYMANGYNYNKLLGKG